MTWHLERVIASVPASSVASPCAGLLIDAPAPLWGQRAAAQAGPGVLWLGWIAPARWGTVFVDVHVCRLVQAGVGIL